MKPAKTFQARLHSLLKTLDLTKKELAMKFLVAYCLDYPNVTTPVLKSLTDLFDCKELFLTNLMVLLEKDFSEPTLSLVETAFTKIETPKIQEERLSAILLAEMDKLAILDFLFCVNFFFSETGKKLIKTNEFAYWKLLHKKYEQAYSQLAKTYNRSNDVFENIKTLFLELRFDIVPEVVSAKISCPLLFKMGLFNQANFSMKKDVAALYNWFYSTRFSEKELEDTEEILNFLEETVCSKPSRIEQFSCPVAEESVLTFSTTLLDNCILPDLEFSYQHSLAFLFHLSYFDQKEFSLFVFFDSLLNELPRIFAKSVFSGKGFRNFIHFFAFFLSFLSAVCGFGPLAETFEKRLLVTEIYQKAVCNKNASSLNFSNTEEDRIGLDAFPKLVCKWHLLVEKKLAIAVEETNLAAERCLLFLLDLQGVFPILKSEFCLKEKLKHQKNTKNKNLTLYLNKYLSTSSEEALLSKKEFLEKAELNIAEIKTCFSEENLIN